MAGAKIIRVNTDTKTVIYRGKATDPAIAEELQLYIMTGFKLQRSGRMGKQDYLDALRTKKDRDEFERLCKEGDKLEGWRNAVKFAKEKLGK